MKQPLVSSMQRIAMLTVLFAMTTVSWASTQTQATTSTLPAKNEKKQIGAKHNTRSHESTHLYLGNAPVGVRMRLDHEKSNGATVVDIRKMVHRGRTVFEATLVKGGETSVITMDSPGDVLKRVVVSKSKIEPRKADQSNAEEPKAESAK